MELVLIDSCKTLAFLCSILGTSIDKSFSFPDFTEEERNLGLHLSQGAANSANPQRPQNNLDAASANNAAFMALRANPETTIRPLGNSGSGLGSPEGQTGQSLGIAPSASATDLHSTSSHDPQFSAASELINRYRLEQTINQLRGHHGFAWDPRGITGLPFNQHNQV